ncbi:MAG: hypothetical protein ACTMIL_01605, partial [Brevibacterium aurantiacum]
VFVGRRPNWVMRALLIVAGLLTFAPELAFSVIGVVLGAVCFFVTRFWNLGGEHTPLGIDKDALSEESVLAEK